MVWSSSWRAVHPVPAERALVTKERQSRSYRLSAYYLASSFSQMPILCVLPTINITIIYFMVGLPYRYG